MPGPKPDFDMMKMFADFRLPATDGRRIWLPARWPAILF